jgi:hypothetical protein
MGHKKRNRRKAEKDLAQLIETHAQGCERAPTYDRQQDRSKADEQAVLAHVLLLWIGIIHPYQEDHEPNY